MSAKVTKGGIVGLLGGIGLAAVFPWLGVPLVIAGAVSGAAIGYAKDEEEKEEGRTPEEGIEGAERLLDEFDAWDRKLVDGAEQGVPLPRLPDPSASPASAPEGASRLFDDPPQGQSRAAAAPPGPSRPPARPHGQAWLNRAGNASAPRSQTSSKESPSLYDQVATAEALLRAGRFLEAIDQFRALKDRLLAATVAASPSDRQRVVEGLRTALHRLAGVLIENDSPAEADELLKEALEISPDDYETLMHLGRLALMLDRTDEAAHYLLRAIEIAPSDPDPYRLLGDAYVEAGRVNDARSLFRQAADAASDSAITIEMLERIGGLDTDDPAPLAELGQAQAEEANWEEAARAYRQALNRAPGDSAIRTRLGVAELRAGHVSEGREDLRDIPDLENDLDALLELAHCLVSSGEDSEALSLLRRFRELDRQLAALDPIDRRASLRDHGILRNQVDAIYAPLRLRALLDLASVETRIGSVEEAEVAVQEAITYGGSALGPEAAGAATALAAEYQRRGDTLRARGWSLEADRLGGSLERVRREKDTYEDFLRRFKYQPRDLVAEGGMARVYRGLDTRSGKTVAIKRMHDRFCTDPQAVAYFYREVRALEELSRPYPHPNIVEFIASGVTECRFIFAMEFVDGSSLRDVMDRGDEWPLISLCLLAEGICAGLDRAHNSVRSIIHRDLKPENVLLAAGNIPKLTDFGICRVSSLFSASRRYYGSERSFVGTGLYSAPEQYPDPYSGQVPVADARTDIYSLGCILYEILTTQPPFLASDPGQIGLMHQRRPLPGQSAPQPLLAPSERNPLTMARFTDDERKRLDAMVLRCLELRPSRRYRTARDLKAELEALRATA